MFVDWFADVPCYLYEFKRIISQTFQQVLVRVTMTLDITQVHLHLGVSFKNRHHGLYQGHDYLRPVNYVCAYDNVKLLIFKGTYRGVFRVKDLSFEV